MNIAEQIATLESINRLLDNEDFQRQLLPYFQQLHDHAHAALLNPKNTGPELEYARARYMAAREIRFYLADRKSSLEHTIKAKQSEK